MAEFDDPDALVRAAHAVHAAGYRESTPTRRYPIEEVSDALGHHHSKLPLIVLGGGITGALAGFGLAYWSSVIDYPMNIGGKPLNSWPAFIVPTFETHDPVRRARRRCSACWRSTACRCPITRCSTSRASRAPRATATSSASRPGTASSTAAATREFLESLDPVEVSEVEHVRLTSHTGEPRRGSARSDGAAL